MQKITPFLWFDSQAEEATRFYVSTFKNAKVLNIFHWGDAGPGPKGTVMGTEFKLEGQQFKAINGGPHFSFTPAISLYVNCDTQAEVDHLWETLSEGGEKQPCGWLKDRYGVSWQIIPAVLSELLHSSDAETASRTMKAMLQMTKIDIGALRRAASSSHAKQGSAQ